jgi:protein-S-isoprenylcysteine O-methyltransferase Ste14
MVSINTIVEIFIALLVIGAIFGVMFGILWYIEVKYPSMKPWFDIIRIILVVLLGLALIGMLLAFSGHPVVRFDTTTRSP